MGPGTLDGDGDITPVRKRWTGVRKGRRVKSEGLHVHMADESMEAEDGTKKKGGRCVVM